MEDKDYTLLKSKEALVQRLYRDIHGGSIKLNREDSQRVIRYALEEEADLKSPLVQAILQKLQQEGIVEIHNKSNLFMEIKEAADKYQNNGRLSFAEVSEFLRRRILASDGYGQIFLTKKDLQDKISFAYTYYKVDQEEVQTLLKKLETEGLIKILDIGKFYIEIRDLQQPAHFTNKSFTSMEACELFGQWLDRKAKTNKIIEIDPLDVGFARAEPGEKAYFRFFRLPDKEEIWVLRRSSDDRASFFEPYDKSKHIAH